MNIQYCFYHLPQSIWRKIQSLGLTNLYESNDDFCLFCGQIDALAFLPVDEVSEGMAFLRESIPDEAAPLLEYFDTTYVTGHMRPRPQNQDLQLRFRRVLPMFPPAQWNMHEITLADQPRLTMHQRVGTTNSRALLAKATQQSENWLSVCR